MHEVMRAERDAFNRKRMGRSGKYADFRAAQLRRQSRRGELFRQERAASRLRQRKRKEAFREQVSKDRANALEEERQKLHAAISRSSDLRRAERDLIELLRKKKELHHSLWLTLKEEIRNASHDRKP
jgi:hypothetical protein